VAAATLSFISMLAVAEPTAPEKAATVAQDKQSQAVRLSDAELDKITAGEMVLILFTPGQNGHTVGNSNAFVLINCGSVFPCGGNPSTFGVLTVNGRTHCIGAAVC